VLAFQTTGTASTAPYGGSASITAGGSAGANGSGSYSTHLLCQSL
jgi:hypothetical protein